jgi:hypothetical protein
MTTRYQRRSMIHDTSTDDDAVDDDVLDDDTVDDDTGDRRNRRRPIDDERLTYDTTMTTR